MAGEAFVKAGMFERFVTRHRPFVFVFNTPNPAWQWLGIGVADNSTLTAILADPGA